MVALIAVNKDDNKTNSLRAVAPAAIPRNLLEHLRVVKAPRADAPFPIQAIAVEEDTSLVLSADIEVRDPRQHPIRLMTELYNDPQRLPGSIVVKNTCPTYLLAIVHDFDQQPSWQAAWIVSCLENIFEICAQRQISALGLEPLGTKHGRLGENTFLQLLRKSMQSTEPNSLRRLWLITPDCVRQHQNL